MKLVIFLIFCVLGSFSFCNEIEIGRFKYLNESFEEKEMKISFSLEGNEYSDGYCYYLYVKDFFLNAFIVDKHMRERIIDATSKSMEWHDIAQMNNVNKFCKNIYDKENIELLSYLYDGFSWTPTGYMIDFIFSRVIKEDEVKSYLHLNYRSVYELNSGELGAFIVFNMDQLKSLSNILNNANLQNFLESANLEQKKEELFN